MEEAVKVFFRLTAYVYADEPSKRSYPQIDLIPRLISYFPTQQEAAAEIGKQQVHFENADIFCWVIAELPTGEVPEDFESVYEWIYYPDGDLYCRRSCLNTINSQRFPMTRSLREHKFKPGDIVEVFGYPGNFHSQPNRIALGLVTDAPGKDFHFDDYFVLISGCDPDPVPVPVGSLFQARLEVPAPIKEDLENLFRCYCKDVAQEKWASANESCYEDISRTGKSMKFPFRIRETDGYVQYEYDVLDFESFGNGYLDWKIRKQELVFQSNAAIDVMTIDLIGPGGKITTEKRYFDITAGYKALSRYISSQKIS